MLEVVHIQRQAQRFFDHYETSFEVMYGSRPEYDRSSKDNLAAMEWLYKYCKKNHAPFIKGNELITAYLGLKDDFLINSGYPLRFFRSKINAIIVGGAMEYDLVKQNYVVGYSESGRPVVSHEPKAVQKHFKPVLWEDWVKADIGEKFQLSQKNWQDTGNDTKTWIENWRTWGFLECAK